jgi:hypothetical protein
MKTFKLILIAALVSAAVLSCEPTGQEDDIESSITEIEITAARTVYGLGETIDPAGLVVTATFEDETEGAFAVNAKHLSPKAAPDAAQTGFIVTVTVNGHEATFTIDVFPVVSKSSTDVYTGRDNLIAAFTNLATGDTITLYNNQTINNGTDPFGKTVTLQGYGSAREITHTPQGIMFALSKSGTVLILGDKITLNGKGNDNANPLVQVNSGTALVMEDGSNITGGDNKNPSTGGGAVYVNGGVFTMNGGTISGNWAASYGGGVCVNGGKFYMYDGTISGNEGNYGGGVCVRTSGTFTMSGGTISGNEGNYGGGVFVYGRFTYNGGTLPSNTGVGSAVYKDSAGVINGNGGVDEGTGSDKDYDVFPPPQ